MRADTLVGQIIAVLSRRASVFQPLPREPRSGLAGLLRFRQSRSNRLTVPSNDAPPLSLNDKSRRVEVHVTGGMLHIGADAFRLRDITRLSVVERSLGRRTFRELRITVSGIDLILVTDVENLLRLITEEMDRLDAQSSSHQPTATEL